MSESASNRHTHRFLRLHCPTPRSLKAPLANPCCDTDASHSPYLSPSPALSSRPPSTSSIAKLAMHDAATGNSHPPAPNDLIHPQRSTGRLCVDGAPGDASRQPTQISQPIIPVDVVDASSTPKVNLQDLVASAQQPIPLLHLPASGDSTHSLHPSGSLATSLQQSSVLARQSPSGNDLPPPQNQNRSVSYPAYNIPAIGDFNDDANNFNNSDNFMEALLRETIPGAAADSSARDPPPRCHPGTRLDLLERCLYFIAHCNGEKKMLWVVGAAGVGKSAIMQSVAESPLEVATNASVFFYINGRDDATKAIVTLSWQLAAKFMVYRKVLEDQVTNSPWLLQSSMATQFEKFIVQPFIHNHDLSNAGRVLIIIDGLDECRGTHTQVELLRLISNLCISYPSSPIVWVIASRPELHITSFFSNPEVVTTYEKEEICVDSNEALSDVERFLRHELKTIRAAFDFLDPQWPTEQVLWKLAAAVGGLFACAQTVIRYIGNSSVGDPASQLSEVLDAIDHHALTNVPREERPMALLDTLYTQILSKVPLKIMINARKLLFLLASGWDQNMASKPNFIIMCNWLGMTPDDAYAAVKRLQSVLYLPNRHKAHQEALRCFHKSFIDYILRSALFPNTGLAAQQIKSQLAFRVLEEAPSGIAFDETYPSRYGLLKGGIGDKIRVVWRANKRIGWDDSETRLNMYTLAIGEIVAGIRSGDPELQSEFCVKILTTRFQAYSIRFPHDELRHLVFGKSRRDEFMKCGILKEIPVTAVDSKRIIGRRVKMQFYSPVTATTSANPWNSSCQHERGGQRDQQKEQNWTTSFLPKKCAYCFKRLRHQLESFIIRSPPNHAVPIMFTSTGECCVELHFVEPEDDVSEWTYWLWLFELDYEENITKNVSINT